MTPNIPAIGIPSKTYYTPGERSAVLSPTNLKETTATSKPFTASSTSTFRKILITTLALTALGLYIRENSLKTQIANACNRLDCISARYTNNKAWLTNSQQQVEICLLKSNIASQFISDFCIKKESDKKQITQLLSLEDKLSNFDYCNNELTDKQKASINYAILSDLIKDRVLEFVVLPEEKIQNLKLKELTHSFPNELNALKKRLSFMEKTQNKNSVNSYDFNNISLFEFYTLPATEINKHMKNIPLDFIVLLDDEKIAELDFTQLSTFDLDVFLGVNHFQDILERKIDAAQIMKRYLMIPEKQRATIEHRLSNNAQEAFKKVV